MKKEYRINDECVKFMLVKAYTCTDTYMQICSLISLLVVTKTNKTLKKWQIFSNTSFNVSTSMTNSHDIKVRCVQ